MVSKEFEVNNYGRVRIGEMIGTFIALAEKQGRLSDDAVRARISHLRTLVGPMNLSEFLAESKSLWQALKSDADHYSRSTYGENRKEFKKILKSSEFIELWALSTLNPPLKEQWIRDNELWGWIEQFSLDNKLIEGLLSALYIHGVEVVLERIQSPLTPDELVLKIQRLDITGTEFRRLSLALELKGKETVIPITEPTPVPFELPEPKLI